MFGMRAKRNRNVVAYNPPVSAKGSTPWPFTNCSYAPVDRRWASLLLRLFRRTDRQQAKNAFAWMRAWRKHLDIKPTRGVRLR